MEISPLGNERSDTLVLFGITGDLVRAKILPALYPMDKRGVLDVPVVGVASSKWDIARLHARATESIEEQGGVDDPEALRRLLSRLAYFSGNYRDSGTYEALKKALGNAKRPAYYLAIPPALFETTSRGLGALGLARQARVILEKPFWTRSCFRA